MIKYEWRNQLDAEEAGQLTSMLRRAAQYDAEPEYSGIGVDDLEHSMRQSSPTEQHLVIWMLPHAVAMDQPERPQSIAGLIRLTFLSEDTAEATVVIDPGLRSIGILTLFLEQVGLDTEQPAGWLGTGARHLTSWARGNHPATGRISNRFLIPHTRRMWKLIRPIGTAADGAAAPVLESVTQANLHELGWAARLPHGRNTFALRENGSVLGVVVLDLVPVSSEEYGPCATTERIAFAPQCDGRQRRHLLDGAAALVREAGPTGLIIYVDSDDAALVHACRLTGFQHDRTDVRYEIGGR